MNAQQLPGMPHPWPLRVTRTGDGRAVAVHAGPILQSAFRAGDMECWLRFPREVISVAVRWHLRRN